MVANGTPRSKINTAAALIVVKHESSGNPSAYNGWDSNAAAGTPSEGIAQVIGPTFRAYSVPGHTNIWNPVDNMIAAFRYAINRYGSMNNIPGVVAVRHSGYYVGYLAQHPAGRFPDPLMTGDGGLPSPQGRPPSPCTAPDRTRACLARSSTESLSQIPTEATSMVAW
jgi:hypothetical protein